MAGHVLGEKKNNGFGTVSAEQLEAAEVERAMRTGWSWPEVAEALGVTRQAVHKKHAKRLIAAGVELRRR